MAYFIHTNGETRGPYTMGQLRTMWNTGAVTADTLYCREGGQEWIQLRILIDEFEQPLHIPPIIPSTRQAIVPPVFPVRRKKGKATLAVVCLVILGGILVLGIVGNLVDPGSSHDTATSHESTEPMAVSGIESLPPITVRLNDELLKTLKMTDDLDALYKRGCSSEEFTAAGAPAESAALPLQSKLPEGDPRRDLLVNTFEAYQQVAIAMKRKEEGSSSDSADALIVVAGVRKILLTKILEGHMTPEEQNMYYTWRKSLTQ